MTSNYRLERFIIYINNHTEQIESAKSLETSVGQEITLSIRRTFLNKLSSPYSNCRSEVTFEFNSTVTSFPYFISDCVQVFCYFKIIATECNKTKEYEANEYLYYIDKNAFRMFTIYLKNNCNPIKQEIDKRFKEIGPEIICRERCPIECHKTVYNLESRYNIIKSSEPLSAYINIYYESFDYTLIEEAPRMEPFDLFGYIGGYFGN